LTIDETVMHERQEKVKVIQSSTNTFHEEHYKVVRYGVYMLLFFAFVLVIFWVLYR